MTITCELTVYRVPNIRYVCAGVVGNLEEVGCWDTRRVIRSQTTSGSLHRITINLPEQTRLEYKWLLYDGDTWMWEPGNNKVVDLPKYGSCFIMNQWAGPAVVETQAPERGPTNRRSNRTDTEWKVGTAGTVYKNPAHIPTATPVGNVTMFTGTKIPFGENYIQDPPPAPVTESSENIQEITRKLVNDTARQYEDPESNDLTTAHDVSIGSSAATNTDRVCTTSGTRECGCRADDIESGHGVLNHVRTIASTCCHRVSNATSELSTEKQCVGIALSCLLFYGAYRTIKQ